MDNFITWLNTEIEDLKTTGGNNLFMQGKLSEAIRIRAIFNDITKSPEELAAEICNHYCKFPEAYDAGHDDDNDRMIEERCDKCPLNEVVK